MACLSFAILVASTLVSLSHGARILVVFPMCTRSHYNLGFQLTKGLINRGHQVVFISAFPQKKPIENLTDISVAEVGEILNKKKKNLYEVGTWSFVRELQFASNFAVAYHGKAFQVKEVQELFHSNEKFDLVILENFFHEIWTVFQYKFNCPLILLAPGPTTLFNDYIFANPSQPAYVPNLLANFGPSMTFWERLLNLYYDIVGELFVQFVHIPNQNFVLQNILPGAPDIKDLIYNASFLLLASHVSLRDPYPLQPNIKEIGGYHLLPSKPLPKDLQDFMDQAPEGVIVFSMGSMLKGTDFPEEIQKAILRSFSKLKQKVLWKFETNVTGKPDNVKIVSWLPQQDALGHPNVVLFVTHGGLLGKIEAIYNGVPMLGLPVFWDQMQNCHESFHQGYGLTIPFFHLTEENFSRALKELINNSKYKLNAERRSKIIRDQPVKQMDEAMFWIEYVIRHKGAPHFKSGALKLKWYQRLLVDVILVVIVATVLILAIMVYIARKLFKSVNTKILDYNIRKKLD